MSTIDKKQRIINEFINNIAIETCTMDETERRMFISAVFLKAWKTELKGDMLDRLVTATCDCVNEILPPM